jgi:hypothetical protein
MIRYFFDVVSEGRSERDAVGTTFSDSQEAHKCARLLALALESTSEHEFVRGRVGVRSSDGGELYSVPMGRRGTAMPFIASSRATFLDAVSGSKLWAALRGRLPGVKAPDLASEVSGKGADI